MSLPVTIGTGEVDPFLEESEWGGQKVNRITERISVRCNRC